MELTYAEREEHAINSESGLQKLEIGIEIISTSMGSAWEGICFGGDKGVASPTDFGKVRTCFLIQTVILKSFRS